MSEHKNIASIILAAGRGSRMRGYSGSKTLLPLVPSVSISEGSTPMLSHIINTLPEGPKAIIVNYNKEDVIKNSSFPEIYHYEQPVLNGTGGAVLAARPFLEKISCPYIIITMGDIPLVSTKTYLSLVDKLNHKKMAVLGFIPADRKRYGLCKITEKDVLSIVEWEYWHTFSEENLCKLSVCNAGVYAVQRKELLRLVDMLEKKPHIVKKMSDGELINKTEYFLTDIIEYLTSEGNPSGYVLAENELEVIGVDDFSSLQKVQHEFQNIFKS